MMEATALNDNLPSALLALADAVRPEIPTLMTAEEAAKALGVCDKIFRKEVRAQKIRFILIGRRKKFTAADLRAYIDSQRDAQCPSTSRRGRPSTTTISNSKVVGITALRASRIAKKQSR